jgi:pyridoxal phosphate enzyme (YggS family)
MIVYSPMGNGDNSPADELAQAARQALEQVHRRIQYACSRTGRDPGEIHLIGASKTVPAPKLKAFLAAGLEHTGENYIQEGIAKQAAIAATVVRQVHWHFIGALQSNKAREAVEHFDIIHSVDRPSLIQAVDKAAGHYGKIQDVFLQVNIGDEASKAGCTPENALNLAQQIKGCENLRLLGLMCLPPYQSDPEKTRPYFQKVRILRDEIREDAASLAHLSMGMSNDFEIAIEEGATMIRVGTALFGERGT